MDQDMMVRERLPEPIRHLAGQIMDVDSHEQIPAQLWEQEIGPIARELAALWMDDGESYQTDRNHPNVPGFTRDDAPLGLDTLWKTKGGIAPGAVDIGRRPAVMDLMGIKRQLMFPTAGLHCVHLLTDLTYAEKLERDRDDYARELITAYNKWGIEVARKSDRVRPVLPLIADSPAGLLRQAQDLIDNGIRAFWIPSRLPPGGISPAHPDLDPLWALLAASNSPVCLHITSDSHIFWNDVWREAPAFAGFRTLGEFRIDPWSMVNMHTMSQNLLATMVLGGVFERHPTLRMGIAELGGYWIGPLCDTMDLWFHKAIGSITDRMSLPHPPSFYVKRNVRVSPFDFENVRKYIETYDLEDVFAFASDYPHVEGGFDPINRLYDELAPLGQEVAEKFFVKNGQWLLPD